MSSFSAVKWHESGSTQSSTVITFYVLTFHFFIHAWSCRGTSHSWATLSSVQWAILIFNIRLSILRVKKEALTGTSNVFHITSGSATMSGLSDRITSAIRQSRTLVISFFLSFNLLIAWQLSIWNCCKPFFSLLYNCQLLCFWRLD
jgi:hypothetical protein